MCDQTLGFSAKGYRCFQWTRTPKDLGFVRGLERTSTMADLVIEQGSRVVHGSQETKLHGYAGKVE